MFNDAVLVPVVLLAISSDALLESTFVLLVSCGRSEAELLLVEATCGLLVEIGSRIMPERDIVIPTAKAQAPTSRTTLEEKKRVASCLDFRRSSLVMLVLDDQWCTCKERSGRFTLQLLFC